MTISGSTPKTGNGIASKAEPSVNSPSGSTLQIKGFQRYNGPKFGVKEHPRVPLNSQTNPTNGAKLGPNQKQHCKNLVTLEAKCQKERLSPIQIEKVGIQEPELLFQKICNRILVIGQERKRSEVIDLKLTVTRG